MKCRGIPSFCTQSKLSKITSHAQHSRSLLIECDANRYEIPGESIVAISLEPFVSPLDHTTKHWMICLLFQVSDGTCELIFTDATPSFAPGKEKPRLRVNEKRVVALTQLTNQRLFENRGLVVSL